MTKTEWVIAITIIALTAAGVGWFAVYNASFYCVQGHTETQYSVPPSVVVGQSKDFGGIAVPTGNMRPVEVFVCDVHAKRQSV